MRGTLFAALVLLVAARSGRALVCASDADCPNSFGSKCHPGPSWCDINGTCTNPAALDCDDGDPCSDDSCSESAPGNGCVHVPHCPDDGLVCNGTNSCILIPFGFPPIYFPTCAPGTPLDCDDQNACTIDSCGEPNGCQHVAIVCDDGNLCTQDVCDVQEGCLHVPIAGCCQTSADCPTDTCATGVQCVAHACTGGTAKSCDDGNPCTTDSCDPATGCAHAAVAGCCRNDADCAATGDPCTAQTCDAAHTCEEHPATGLGAIVCACAQPSPSVCNGQPVPASLTKRVAHACALIGQAQSGGAKEQKLIARAAELFGRAARALQPSGGKGVSATCAGVLKAKIGDVHGRAETLLDQL